MQVLAAADGTIFDLKPGTPGTCFCKALGRTIAEKCLGNHVVMTHANGFTTTYAHLTSFSTNIAKGKIVTRGTSLGVMGSTGCSTAPHIHFQVNNLAGLLVDPFGWLPFPDSTYGRSGEPDPWRQYQLSQQQPRDGTSHYLWIHPLDRRVVNNRNQQTVITSVSGETTAIFPVNAYAGPYRIELWDSLNSPEIEDTSVIPLSTFALYAYNRDEQPIWSLLNPVQIEYRLDNLVQTIVQSPSVLTEYHIYQWNDETKLWNLLNTTYDSQTGLISASSTKLGRFAVTKTGHTIFLPLIIKGQ